MNIRATIKLRDSTKGYVKRTTPFISTVETNKRRELFLEMLSSLLELHINQVPVKEQNIA